MAATKVSHRWRLVSVFFAWKALLFTLTAFCPGHGYDSSALILTDASDSRHTNHEYSSLLNHLSLNLFRWDALYFVKAAERGLVFEQEWAFSPVFSRLLDVTTQFVSGSSRAPIFYYIVSGVFISTTCHLISVLILYRLLTLLTGAERRQSQIPFVASVLHIVTPASLFLSTAYAESLFSLCNMAGMLCYAESKAAANPSTINAREVAYKLSSGFLFALATTVRSNGLLSGLIFLYDVARYLPKLLSMRSSVHDAYRITVTCVSGVLIAISFVGPQYLAYQDFCIVSDSTVRPWCGKKIPSIYSWVQSHYWNVGLFRYWTLSNLPLFMLAFPMLWLLIYSSVTILCIGYALPLYGRPVPHASGTPDAKRVPPIACNLPELALPQLILAFAAATSFHVQIVNRIASGYPLWYLTVASWLVGHQRDILPGGQSSRGQWAIRAMIMYSMIQGMLFANFLPPA